MRHGQPALITDVTAAFGQLRECYAITHATLQVDHVREADKGPLTITSKPAGSSPARAKDTHGPVHRPAPGGPDPADS